MIPSVFFLATLGTWIIKSTDSPISNNVVTVGCIGATRAYMLAPQAEVMVWGAYTLTMTLANNIICTGTINSGFKISSHNHVLPQVSLDSRFGNFKGLSKAYKSSTPMSLTRYQ